MINAVEHKEARYPDWSPAFFEELARTDEGLRAAIDEMLRALREHRTSKKAPHFDSGVRLDSITR